MSVRLLIVILTLTCSMAQAKSKPVKRNVANSVSAAIKSATGLQEGMYFLKKGIPVTCLQGLLELRETNGQVNLLLTENALLTNLTLEDNEVSYKNDGCGHLIVNHRQDSKISSTHTRTCGKDVTVFRRKVAIAPTSVVYTVVGELNGKVTTNVTCELAKAK